MMDMLLVSLGGLLSLQGVRLTGITGPASRMVRPGAMDSPSSDRAAPCAPGDGRCCPLGQSPGHGTTTTLDRRRNGHAASRDLRPCERKDTMLHRTRLVATATVIGALTVAGPVAAAGAATAPTFADPLAGIPSIVNPGPTGPMGPLGPHGPLGGSGTVPSGLSSFDLGPGGPLGPAGALGPSTLAPGAGAPGPAAPGAPGPAAPGAPGPAAPSPSGPGPAQPPAAAPAPSHSAPAHRKSKRSAKRKPRRAAAHRGKRSSRTATKGGHTKRSRTRRR
jgi:hypothetical protein